MACRNPQYCSADGVSITSCIFITTSSVFRSADEEEAKETEPQQPVPSVRPDEVPPIPENRFLMRRSPQPQPKEERGKDKDKENSGKERQRERARDRERERERDRERWVTKNMKGGHLVTLFTRICSLRVRLVSVSVCWTSVSQFLSSSRSVCNAVVSALAHYVILLCYIIRHCVLDPRWIRDQIAPGWWWPDPAGELKEEDPGWEPDCVCLCVLHNQGSQSGVCEVKPGDLGMSLFYYCGGKNHLPTDFIKWVLRVESLEMKNLYSAKKNRQHCWHLVKCSIHFVK